jgi:hypothetical protein
VTPWLSEYKAEVVSIWAQRFKCKDEYTVHAEGYVHTFKFEANFE